MPKIVSAHGLRFKALIYGDPGSGKTTWACTAQDHPAMSPVLVIDSDDGLLSVAARGDIAAEDVKTLKEYETILGRVASGDKAFREFKTVVTDSGSDLLDKALREVAHDRAGKGKGGIDELFQRDYGIATMKMKRLFDIARNLPAHCIVTSLAASHYPMIGDQLAPQPDSVHPAFTQKLGLNIRGLVDFVWYFYRTTENDVQRFNVLTQDRGPFKAKTRGTRFPAALGEHFADKSLPEIYEMMLREEA